MKDGGSGEHIPRARDKNPKRWDKYTKYLSSFVRVIVTRQSYRHSSLLSSRCIVLYFNNIEQRDDKT